MGKLLYNYYNIIIIVGSTRRHHPNGQCFFAIAVFKMEVKFKKRYVKGLQI